MFIPPDMHSVKVFREELVCSLRENQFPFPDIQQIELACDEAVTNAITANIKNQSKETIICKWKILNLKFVLTILDYGKGIPKEKLEDYEGPKNLKEYIEKVNQLQKENTNTLPFGGKEKIHKNMGQGLKIIKRLMDAVKILYHNEEMVVSDPKETNNIEGSILEIEFHSKKNS
jgi:anti-sigma regulatory factor (Ser/Thr protein kinase)